MRIGLFIAPISTKATDDSKVIDSTLSEAELAEEIGLDAIWLTEHHFTGESVYADPIVFGTAIAARTTRIKIGFAVVEMALHHPVRLAVQTALLDNLSHGRLIVGTGRGSAFNHYEYAGFGTTLNQGVDQLDEAEELLVKAWTAKDIYHKGKYWTVTIPELRPGPYQKPHPPLLRATLSEGSIRAMASIGRPILMGGLGDQEIVDRINLYRGAMSESGFDDKEIEIAVDQIWIWKGISIAETYELAREQAEQGFQREQKHVRKARSNLNPKSDVLKPESLNDYEEQFEKSFIIGTPDQVFNQIDHLKQIGLPNLMLKFNTGQIDPEIVSGSMKLLKNGLPNHKDRQ